MDINEIILNAPVVANGNGGVSPLSLSPRFFWDAANYSETPGPHVPNSVSTEEVDGNLLRGGNRLMSTFASHNGTLTIGNQTDHLGNANSANTFVAANTGQELLAAPQPITISNAGTYTFSVWLKSNTGVSQSIKYGFYAGTAGKSLQTATVTTTWQQFTHTATFTAGQTTYAEIALTGNGVDVPNVMVDSPRIDAGATPGDPVPLSGHMYLGRNGADASQRPSVANGALQFANAKPSYAQFASAETIQNPFTLVAWVRQNATGPVVGGILSKFGSAYSHYFLGTDSGGPASAYSDSNVLLSPSVFDLASNGYHLVWMSYDGTGTKLGVDDVVIERDEQVRSSRTVEDLEFGAAGGFSTLYFPGDVAFIGQYNKILTQAELKGIREYGRSVATLNGQSTGKLQTVLVVEGDSISDYSFYSYVYPTKHVSTLSQKVFCVMTATSGSTIATATSQRAAWVDSFCANAGGDYSTPRRRILSIFLGANDATNYASAQAWCDALEVYVNARKAAQNANDKIIVCTLLPNQNSGFNARRNEINTILRTWVGAGKCDALADFAADAAVGVDAASANATYYPDGVHPSNATHTILGPIHKAAVESVL